MPAVAADYLRSVLAQRSANLDLRLLSELQPLVRSMMQDPYIKDLKKGYP